MKKTAAWVLAGVAMVTAVVVGLRKEKLERPGIKETGLSALYPCEDRLLNNVPFLPFNGKRNDSRVLAKDLFLILDSEKNETLLYTPRFAGRVSLEKDIQGNPILRMVKDKPHDPKKTKELLDMIRQAAKNSGFKDTMAIGVRDVGDAGKERPQYNIRIPYWPNGEKGEGAGFYYLTINDTPFGGHHDSRINLPPRYLSGPAEVKPDFSREKKSGSISIIREPEEPREHFALTVENELWAETPGGNFSEEARAMLVQDMLARVNSLPGSMQRQIGVTKRGYRFGGEAPSDEELRANAQARYAEILEVCREGARAAGEKALLEAVKKQPKKIGRGEGERGPM